MSTGISNSIRELRAERNMTQQALADLIGLTRARNRVPHRTRL